MIHYLLGPDQVVIEGMKSPIGTLGNDHHKLGISTNNIPTENNYSPVHHTEKRIGIC